MSTDISLALIEDSRISDITSKLTYGVESGAGENTYQNFNANTTSNSMLSWNIQIPSQNVVVDRQVYLQSLITFTIAIAAPVGTAVNTPVFQYGLTDSVQAFPLNSLFLTSSATINNSTVTTTTQDVLPMLMRMYDKRHLSLFNSKTPSMPDDIFGSYADAVGSTNNPMAGINNSSFDPDFAGRGAYPLTYCVCTRGDGAITNVTGANANQLTFTVVCQIKVTEPILFLSPFTNCSPDSSGAGFLGLNTLNLQFTIDQACKRLFSSSTGFITGITLGGDVGGAPISGFTSTSLLLNFLSMTPQQTAKISARNVLPYLDYPVQKSNTNANQPLAAGGNTTYTSNNFQLNQIPELILVCVRQQMSDQDWDTPSGFLQITQASINFNNRSGILSSCNAQQLYDISSANGSAQSFLEWNGIAENNANNGLDAGGSITLASIGSLLVLSPAYDFGLPPYCSSSSLGQYNFQITLQCTNQYAAAITPEIVVIPVNSGIFTTDNGVSSLQTGLLTKMMVLETKEKRAAVTHTELKKLIGGKLVNRGAPHLGFLVRKLHQHHEAEGGFSPSGGGTSGGFSSSGGRLQRHFKRSVVE